MLMGLYDDTFGDLIFIAGIYYGEILGWDLRIFFPAEQSISARLLSRWC